MRIKTIGYGKTINTGDYESTRIYLEAELDPTDAPKRELKELEKEVLLLERKIKKQGSIY